MTSYLSTLHKNPKSVISVGPDPIPLKRAVWLGPDCTRKWSCCFTDLRNISQMCFNFFFCWCRIPIIFCKQPGPGSGQADMVGPRLAPICLPPRSPTFFPNGKIYVRWRHAWSSTNAEGRMPYLVSLGSAWDPSVLLPSAEARPMGFMQKTLER